MKAGGLALKNLIQPTISLEMPVPSQGHYGFHSFPGCWLILPEYWNKIGKIVVKAVPKFSEVIVKNNFTSHIDKKNIFDMFVDCLIFIHFHYMKIHRLSSSLSRNESGRFGAKVYQIYIIEISYFEIRRCDKAVSKIACNK
jgi:hypothetical protein